MPPNPNAANKPIDVKRAKQVKDWLKAHGHKSAAVDAMAISDVAGLRTALCAVHRMTVAEYRSITGITQ